MSKRLVLLVVLVVAGLALACGGGEERASTATPTSAANPTVSPTSTPAGRPTVTETAPAYPKYAPKVSLTEHGVYLVRPDGSGLRRLTPAADRRYSSVWSPDGSRLAIASRGGVPQVSVIDVETGSEVTVLVYDASGSDSWVGSPLWSPDGRQLAIAAGPYEQTAGWHVYLVNADGSGEPVYLFEGSLLEWSPDGSALAFVAYSERGVTLQTFDLTTRTATIIARAGGLDSFAWSPDSQRMAYTVAPRPSNFEAVVVIDRDGFNRRIVAEGGSRPEWSPNGEYLAFIDHVGQVAVAQMSPSSYPVHLAPHRGVVIRWSPEGDAILVWDTSSLSLLSLATHEPIDPIDLTVDVVPTWWASFSPDGQRVAFSGRESGFSTTSPEGLFVTNADGRALEKLAQVSFGIPWGPEWSPDGRYIAFVVGGTAIS